jgi:hypothetical protein
MRLLSLKVNALLGNDAPLEACMCRTGFFNVLLNDLATSDGVTPGDFIFV